MPQLRKDPVIGRWVIIATERAKRPQDFATAQEWPPEGKCPFCEGHEQQTPPEVFALRKPGTQANSRGWDVRVVSSIAPLLHIEGELGRRGQGLYDLMNGVGAHEIIVETPQHIANIADLEVGQISKVISSYVERIVALSHDERFKYALIFKNYGRSAGGGSVRHSRSQLIATPINPKRVKEKLDGALRYFEYKERCIFCDIIAQELAQQERVIADVDGFVALAPFASRFPFEICILPKEHNCDFISIKSKEREGLATILKLVLSKLKKGLNDPPYNYVLHTAPFRRQKAGYWRSLEMDYHWHIEIIPRLTRVAGFEWGTGFYLNSTSPEDATSFLKGVEV
jgi:UDPglucose--hexose-1-phosphate uridylyltransferase